MSRARGLWAAAATGVQVGVAVVLSRAALAEVGPVALAALRYLIGALVLLPVALALRPAPVRRGDRAAVAVLGVAQFGVLIALLNWGLARVGAAEASLLFATFPVMTVLLAAALGRERLTAVRLVGAALSFAGVALALGTRPAGTDPAGAGAVLLAALVGSVSAIGTRPYLQRNATLSVGLLAMAAAALTLGMAAVPLEGLPMAISPRATALVLAIGVVSGAGYLLWLTALKFAEAGEATVLLGLSPITAALLGGAFLHELPGPGLWTGTAVALAGVTLTVLPPRPKRLAERPLRR